MKKQYNTPKVCVENFLEDVIVMSAQTLEDGSRGYYDDFI